ncbi:MAG: hypothetical protein JO360_01620 [Acidobacteria bacterium]|nr:hypothetical protein [Acidobacteriota bacterium]
MKAYIISFYQQEISDDELSAFLKTRSAVLNLMQILPNTIFIVSDRNASDLAGLVEKKFPKAFFMIAEYLPHNSDGALTVEMWDFLNKPKRSRKVDNKVRRKRIAPKSKSAAERK